MTQDYNAEPRRRQCLESVLGQTRTDIEVIVVDGGSADSTLAIAQGFAEKDPRFKAVSQQNQFAGVARNNGFAHSTGDYVIFLDSDDFFDENMIALILQRALDAEAYVVLCRPTALDLGTGKRWLLDDVSCRPPSLAGIRRLLGSSHEGLIEQGFVLANEIARSERDVQRLKSKVELQNAKVSELNSENSRVATTRSNTPNPLRPHSG